MTGDDLKRMQDGFLKTSKEILLETGRCRPVGFVVTRHKHVDKLFETGWGLEFIDVFPKTRDILPRLLALGETVGVDDPYMRLMRPFLETTKLDEKDVIAATMRQICGQVDAFACILHSEAWLRKIDRRSEDAEQVTKEADAKGLAQDQKSIEVIFSSMETYNFARMITVPVHREPSKRRDEGKVLRFGESTEVLDTLNNTNVIEGRLVRFLKPLGIAS